MILREIVAALTSKRSQSPEDMNTRELASPLTCVESKVKDIIAEVTGIDGQTIKHDSPIYRIGSSNDAIEVLMRCEEVFDIDISDEDAEKYETFGELAAYIKSKQTI